MELCLSANDSFLFQAVRKKKYQTKAKRSEGVWAAPTRGAAAFLVERLCQFAATPPVNHITF